MLILSQKLGDIDFRGRWSYGLVFIDGLLDKMGDELRGVDNIDIPVGEDLCFPFVEIFVGKFS